MVKNHYFLLFCRSPWYKFLILCVASLLSHCDHQLNLFFYALVSHSYHSILGKRQCSLGSLDFRKVIYFVASSAAFLPVEVSYIFGKALIWHCLNFLCELLEGYLHQFYSELKFHLLFSFFPTHRSSQHECLARCKLSLSSNSQGWVWRT